MTGTIYQPNGHHRDPVGAVYYSFYATAGTSVTVTGRRLSGPYDMSFWVLEGSYSDTDVFGGSLPSLGYIAFGDDQLSPNVPGPYGDPQVTFVAPTTGAYTVAVTNYYSNGTPPYDFTLKATGVSEAAIPEPATTVPAGIGLLWLALVRRRR
ncbi:MAG: PEP-CTERM sorting domain-containing protein [Bryobacteraceae bacterium]